MSFIDRWKKLLETERNASETGIDKKSDLNITFEAFAEKLKSSSEIEKIPLGFMLEKLIPTLNENNSTESRILLEKLWQTIIMMK